MMIVLSRVLEAVVLLLALRAGAAAVHLPFGDGQGPALRRDLRSRPVPWATLALTTVLVAGLVLCVVWSRALPTLSRSGTSDTGWQLFTAPFVQQGVVGGAFNVVTAAIVLALAEWRWGSLAAAAIWLVGAWAPVGAAAELVGYHVSHANESAYSAGSSGATYFTAGTLCAALLLGAGRPRLLGLAAPLVAGLMWRVANDGHGVMVLAGFALGLVLAVGYAIGHVATGRRWSGHPHLRVADRHDVASGQLSSSARL